jgi:hypothetical protein
MNSAMEIDESIFHSGLILLPRDPASTWNRRPSCSKESRLENNALFSTHPPSVIQIFWPIISAIALTTPESAGYLASRRLNRPNPPGNAQCPSRRQLFPYRVMSGLPVILEELKKSLLNNSFFWRSE